MSAIAKVELRPLTRVLKALGDETRLRIVALLSHGALCVCHLEAALDLPQSNASRQLGVLRAAGVVEARRQGTWVFYELAPQADPLCKEQLAALVGSFEQREVLRKDVERLIKMKGPNACR
jgi:ArsR family transcriptional regulator